MVDRVSNVKAKATSKFELKFTDFLKLIRKNVNISESLLVTDEYTAYGRIGSILPHFTINHSKEYTRGDIHTNTIESFGAILKRCIMGQFHWVSKKYTGLIYQDKFSLILFPFLYVAFKQHFVNNHDKHSWVFDTQY